ncbi:MAG: hypothetical protein NT129_02935 [Candidatus Aenigmarchaeota archaeon]|nr:hypothetical protein [Candidatus Aenigmarchaeota archaeon]
MKGITPVVATILLLLITIAVVGFAFGYFSTIMTTVGTETQKQAGQTTDRLSKSVRIDSASGMNLYISSTGTSDINTSIELSVYVNGLIDNNCTGNYRWTTALGNQILAPSGRANCTLASPGCTGKMVKVIAPAGPTEYSC